MISLCGSQLCQRWQGYVRLYRWACQRCGAKCVTRLAVSILITREFVLYKSSFFKVNIIVLHLKGKAVHDDVIKWKRFLRYWPFVWGILHRWIPLTKASDADLWCFLWSTPEQRLDKQSRRRWFETPSRSLWRHHNVLQDFSSIVVCSDNFPELKCTMYIYALTAM